MNEIALSSNTLTMTSREIAELVGKRHDHVIRDIRTMIEALRDSPNMGHLREDKDSRGYTACFHLDRYYSEILVTGYDVHRRAAVIRRWMELEQKAIQPFKVPQTMAEALRLAADQAEQIEQQKQEVQRLQSVCEIVTNQFRPGMTPPEFARLLNGVNTRAIQGWMIDQGMLMAAHGGYKATSYYRDRYLTQRITESEDLPGRPFVILTTKGAKMIYKRYLKGDLPMKKTWDGQFTHDILIPEQVA